jgi:hypothetical protein
MAVKELSEGVFPIRSAEKQISYTRLMWEVLRGMINHQAMTEAIQGEIRVKMDEIEATTRRRLEAKVAEIKDGFLEGLKAARRELKHQLAEGQDARELGDNLPLKPGPNAGLDTE